MNASKQRDPFAVRWFPALLLTLWVLVPELRRLVDWQVGFNSLPVINLVPVAVILPLAFVYFRRKRAPLPHDFAVFVVLYLVAFGYAFLVGDLSGSMFGAAYELALFCVPVLLGVWLAAMDPPLARRSFERFVTAAIWLGVITSAYALYQFASPPPWDVLWVLNSGLASIGKPEPFALRVFGTLNSPGILADFLALTMLLMLYRLRANALRLIVPLLLCAAALVLTFDRTAWLELAVGFVVFIALSPRRGAVTATVAVTALLTVVLAANLSLITGDPTSNSQLQSRIATLNDLQEDDSANARQEETADALRASVAEPLGQGLGTVGTATKLGAAGSTTVLDNGYLTRLLEMGFFGCALYLIALGTALLITIRRLMAAYAAADVDAATLLATSIGLQIALAGAELSGDHHSALLAVFFWFVVGFSATLYAPRPTAVRDTPRGNDGSIGRPARA